MLSLVKIQSMFVKIQICVRKLVVHRIQKNDTDAETRKQEPLQFQFS